MQFKAKGTDGSEFIFETEDVLSEFKKTRDYFLISKELVEDIDEKIEKFINLFFKNRKLLIEEYIYEELFESFYLEFY